MPARCAGRCLIPINVVEWSSSSKRFDRSATGWKPLFRRRWKALNVEPDNETRQGASRGRVTLLRLIQFVHRSRTPLLTEIESQPISELEHNRRTFEVRFSPIVLKKSYFADD